MGACLAHGIVQRTSFPFDWTCPEHCGLLAERLPNERHITKRTTNYLRPSTAYQTTTGNEIPCPKDLAHDHDQETLPGRTCCIPAAGPRRHGPGSDAGPDDVLQSDQSVAATKQAYLNHVQACLDATKCQGLLRIT